MLSRITGLLSRIADLFVSILCTLAYIIGIYVAIGLVLKLLS